MCFVLVHYNMFNQKESEIRLQHKYYMSSREWGRVLKASQDHLQISTWLALLDPARLQKLFSFPSFNEWENFCSG